MILFNGHSCIHPCTHIINISFNYIMLSHQYYSHFLNANIAILLEMFYINIEIIATGLFLNFSIHIPINIVSIQILTFSIYTYCNLHTKAHFYPPSLFLFFFLLIYSHCIRYIIFICRYVRFSFFTDVHACLYITCMLNNIIHVMKEKSFIIWRSSAHSNFEGYSFN